MLGQVRLGQIRLDLVDFPTECNLNKLDKLMLCQPQILLALDRCSKTGIRQYSFGSMWS